jgi:hypothetical protein
VDIAVEARQLSTELARTRFLLSKLGGKAEEWALGKLVADAICFPDMASMKSDLRLAFEPPQDETVQRSAFLALIQGRLTILEYIQRARHLVSCVTAEPLDMATQVHVFVSGMNTGYQRFYLTRKTPSTLEEAFAVALREDYSVTASEAFDFSRPLAAANPEPTPMEIDAIQHYGDVESRRLFHGSQSSHRRADHGRCGASVVGSRDTVDVHSVLAFLSGTPNLWPHVAVMDPDSMTTTTPDASDGPSCVD